MCASTSPDEFVVGYGLGLCAEIQKSALYRRGGILSGGSDIHGMRQSKAGLFPIMNCCGSRRNMEREEKQRRE